MRFDPSRVVLASLGTLALTCTACTSTASAPDGLVVLESNKFT